MATRNHMIEEYTFELQDLNAPFDLSLPISSPAQILLAELFLDYQDDKPTAELCLSVVAASTAIAQTIQARVCLPGRPFVLSTGRRGSRLQVVSSRSSDPVIGLLILDPPGGAGSEDAENQASRMSLDEFLKMLFNL